MNSLTLMTYYLIIIFVFIVTARILTRQLLVPFLLGFKFNIATLVPILFGILALLAKKAVVISKLALVISSALGLGSLLFGAGGGGPAGYGGYGQQVR